MKIKYWMLIIIIILLVSIAILYKNYKENIVIGDEPGEELKLNMNDLKVCCEYYEKGELKTCSILKRYNCNLCEPKCSS
jgi:hypothetical protein